MKKLILIALIAFGAWKVYQHLHAKVYDAPEMSRSPAAAVATTKSATPAFSCDGRQHCTQMTSRAEAEFFIRHCPDTKMDGDRDGEPCENDSRF